jgi:hypothetical protein
MALGAKERAAARPTTTLNFMMNCVLKDWKEIFKKNG